MSEAAVGFAVLYRWRVRAGQEQACRESWRELTRAIARDRGGLGSRLHRGPGGWHYAYAQWPDRATWLAARAAPTAAPAASERMAATIEERLEPIELEPMDDLLFPPGA